MLFIILHHEQLYICVLEKVFHLMFLFEYKIKKEKKECPKPFFPVKNSKYIQANQFLDAWGCFLVVAYLNVIINIA